MDTKKTISKVVPMSICFSVGAVLFSSHAGGGFASGNQAYQNFVVLGWLGPVAAVLAMLLMTLTIREAMFMYNSRGIDNYKKLFETLYHPFDKIELLFELFFYIMVLMAVAAAIATAASTLQAKLGINYNAGILIVGLIILVLTVFGANLVRKASTIMGMVILVTAVSIFAIGIFKCQDLGSVLTISIQNDGISKLPSAILKAFTYAGFQCVVIPTMIVCGEPLKNHKACSRAMWISFALNTVALVLSVFMLIGWQSVYTTIDGGTTIPTLTSCNQMGISGLSMIYSICLLLCLISTGVTTVFGFVARFQKLKVLSGIKNESIRCAIVSAFIMILAVSISVAGLTNIIKYGYGYCGYLAIAIIIVPFLTVGVYKNRKFIAEHPEYKGASVAEAKAITETAAEN